MQECFGNSFSEPGSVSSAAVRSRQCASWVREPGTARQGCSLMSASSRRAPLLSPPSLHHTPISHTESPVTGSGVRGMTFGIHIYSLTKFANAQGCPAAEKSLPLTRVGRQGVRSSN